MSLYPFPATFLAGVSPLAAFRDLLLANANRAYWGPDATWNAGAPVAWPCVVTGLNAAPGGSGTTLGALNGVPCPVFSGSGRYRTAAFASAIAQPYALVFMTRLDGSAVSGPYLSDGIAAGNRAAIYHSVASTTTRLNAFAGSGIVTSSIAAFNTLPIVTTVNLDGASSTIAVNGAQYANGNVGSHTLTGLTIAQTFGSAQGFVGPIALVAIFHGTNYASRAAAVASAARTLIGV